MVNEAAFFRVVLSMAAACIAAMTPAVHAQTTTAPGEPAAATDTVGLAEHPYVDASFGFSIRPFSDCTVVRHKRVESDGDVELAQFVHPQRAWVMTVRLAHTTKAFNPDDLLAGLEQKLTQQYRDLKILGRQKFKLDDRDAVRLVATVPVGGTLYFRQQAAIFCKDNEFFVIVFNTPAADRAKAEKLFDGMLGSFEILRSEMTQELIQKALSRGAALLRTIGQGGTLGSNLVKEHYLRLVLDGKETGYIWLREGRLTIDRRDGVGLHHEAWFFEPEGKVRRQITEMFLSDDLTSERWNTMIEVISPAKGTTPAQKLTTYEQGVRDADKLLVAFSKRPNSAEMSDKVIEIPESYGPAAIFSLFPRLADRSKADLYAFVSYNSERQGLVLRTLRVIAPQQSVRIDGRTVLATRIEDSEGLIPPITQVYVDEKGEILKVVAGNLEMIATTLDKLKPVYAQKVADTEQLVRQLTKPGEKPPAARTTPGARSGRTGR
jgi:hypothetical protein